MEGSSSGRESYQCAAVKLYVSSSVVNGVSVLLPQQSINDGELWVELWDGDDEEAQSHPFLVGVFD